jgi:hypothetical protein
MRTITLQVPDALADRIEAASDGERTMWALRLASLVEDRSNGRDLASLFREIEAWQAEHGVDESEFDEVFAELAAES